MLVWVDNRAEFVCGGEALYAYIRKGTYPNIFFPGVSYIRVAKTSATPRHSSCSISMPTPRIPTRLAPLALPYPQIHNYPGRQRYSQTDSKLN